MRSLALRIAALSIVVLLAPGCARTTGDLLPTNPGSDATVASDPGIDPPDLTQPEDVPQQPLQRPPLAVKNDRDAKTTILELIASANTEIDVFQFSWVASGSAQEVRDALITAHNRGVAIRVMLDSEPDHNPGMVTELTAAGITAKQDAHPTRLHIKMWAIDNHTVMVGSTNMSGASLDYNVEANVVVTDPGVVGFLTTYLDTLWDSPGFKPSVRTSPDGPLTAWLDGGYLDLVMPALAAATTRIDLVVYGTNLNPNFPDGEVAQLWEAVQAAHQRGVTIRVLFERSDWDDFLNELNKEVANKLKLSGVDVRFDSYEVTTHSKVLITDQTGFIGTNNWSYSGLVLDHEAGVRFTDDTAVSDISAWFDARWSESLP